MERPFLSILSAAGRRDVILGDQPVTIGRHPENRVVIVDPQASRFHCVIEKTPRGVVIRDLDSRNGTKLNGKPIQTAYLTRADVVTIGAVQIRMVVPGSSIEKVVNTPPKPMEKAAERVAPLRKVQREEEQPIQVKAEEDDQAEELVSEILAGSEGPVVDFGMASGSDDDERFLPVLAESLPDIGFEAGDIAMVNRRGQVVHPPESEKPKKRKSQGSGEAVAALRYIILICVKARATDIHLEPKNEDYQLRLRIDGNMVDIVRLSKEMGTKLAALVKIMCDIDVQFRNIVQEGHFSSFIDERRIDYRVSFAPAMFGQKMVVRILDASAAPVHTSDLRLPMWMLEELQRASQLDQGMILACGPTGSGKTTTLYALLRDAGTDKRNVVTIEDPVEIEIDGATQVPVNDEKGNTFPVLLRSMLRQDPDVIMIGEIRDAETAKIAMQAGITGHLVFSTLHTKDSIGTVFRLLDLGVEPYLVAQSLHIVLSQRLARELCSYCKRGVRPTERQIQKMGRAAAGLREVCVPVGCPKCLKTGYAGRRAFFEMLISNDELREVILKEPTPKQIEAALKSTRFVRLEETGYQLVAQGITAFDEIERAVGK